VTLASTPSVKTGETSGPLRVDAAFIAGVSDPWGTTLLLSDAGGIFRAR
jgi:hypothetical protein